MTRIIRRPARLALLAQPPRRGPRPAAAPWRAGGAGAFPMMHLPANLPTLADVEALPDGAARLVLQDGTRISVGLEDRPHMSPPCPEVAAWIGWADQWEEWGVYRVPPALVGRVAWALACRPAIPPTLTGVQLSPEAVTFAALDQDTPWALTAPRGARVSLGIPVPRLSGCPVRLTLQEAGSVALPVRIFFFDVYPETLEGAACLAHFDSGARVGPPDHVAVELAGLPTLAGYYPAARGDLGPTRFLDTEGREHILRAGLDLLTLMQSDGSAVLLYNLGTGKGTPGFQVPALLLPKVRAALGGGLVLENEA